MAESPGAIRILLIEDSPDDERILRRAMRNTRLLEKIHVVDDGEQAMAFLRRVGEHGSAPLPDLILLDLNLPGKEGWEVLEEIKQAETLRAIPVVVLTTSDSEADIRKAYDLQASCFITKPEDFQRLERTMACLEEYWISVASLPSE